MAMCASVTAIGGLWANPNPLCKILEPPGRFDLLSVSDDQRHIVQSTLTGVNRRLSDELRFLKSSLQIR
ncbi:hypothetical protein EYF80_034078 [Liparis tanakae]|uniref:Uncharacterized protein n=1 Tax=Liparis tanakae TaxID=230148 RepID=A0A4Z2GSF8_9TELE|nr:hypothetical protein EYF80_034078 [Liparis tanakae]